MAAKAEVKTSKLGNVTNTSFLEELYKDAEGSTLLKQTARATLTESPLPCQDHITRIYFRDPIIPLLIIETLYSLPSSSPHRNVPHCHSSPGLTLNALRQCRRHSRLRRRYQSYLRRSLFTQLREHCKKYQRSTQLGATTLFQ